MPCNSQATAHPRQAYAPARLQGCKQRRQVCLASRDGVAQQRAAAALPSMRDLAAAILAPAGSCGTLLRLAAAAACHTVGATRLGRLLRLPVLRAAPGGGAAGRDQLLCSCGAAGRDPQRQRIPAAGTRQNRRQTIKRAARLPCPGLQPAGSACCRRQTVKRAARLPCDSLQPAGLTRRLHGGPGQPRPRQAPLPPRTPGRACSSGAARSPGRAGGHRP